MYMGENFRFRMNPLRDFIYCTQFLQAEAMKYAYNCWRREFRGPGEENCGGVLVWQLNDIWPGSSWALVDVDMNRKPAYYIAKRALSKIVVGTERTVTTQPPYITTGYLPEKNALDVWAVNGSLEELDATLKIKFFDISTGNQVGDTQKKNVVLARNRTTELGSFDIVDAHKVVVVAYLEDSATSAQLARWVSWPEPLRLVQMAPGLKVTVEPAASGDKVAISANGPVKGVVLSVPISEPGNDAEFDDNFVDLVPGEVVEVGVQHLQGRSVEARFLYDWELKDDFEL